MRHSIFFILFIFLLNGCVHRGHTLDLRQSTTERHTEQSHDAKADMKQISSTHIVQEENFFNFDDVNKNNISGALILIIGLILVL